MHVLKKECFQKLHQFLWSVSIVISRYLNRLKIYKMSQIANFFNIYILDVDMTYIN